MEKNYGLDFKYDKDMKECIITNNRHVTMYDVELLFRISALGKACKYRKVRKLKPGQSKTIKVKNSRITDVELMKYEYEDINSYIRKNIPMWLSILLYVGTICFLANISSSVGDTIAGILFVTMFPVFTLIMAAGARYDFRQEEKSYYSCSIIEPAGMEM